MITARGVSFAYDSTPTLDDIDLTAENGRVLGLIGPNGSGKTTLIRTLCGMLRPGRGRIEIDGTGLASIKQQRLAQRMAVVVQESAGDLPMTVADMVLLGRTPHQSSFSRDTADDYAIAAQALEHVGARHLAARAFSGLSGGEKQRVLIARALTQQPDHLLLDEPTNHLDIRYQHELLSLIRSLGLTTIIVLHDLNLAARYCDSIVLLDRGQVVASGTTEDVLSSDVLDQVYDIGIKRLTIDDTLQLLFHPLRRHAPNRDTEVPI